MKQIFKKQVASIPMAHCLSAFVIILILDQFTKILTERLISQGSPIPVIPGVFDLVYVKNPGAAWGIMAGKGMLLLAISIIVLILMTVFIKKLTDGWMERYYAISFICAGIAGNSIDRIFRGSVVDFLDFHAANHYHWPAFNVADSAICVGVFVFILSSWLRPQPQPQPQDEKK